MRDDATTPDVLDAETVASIPRGEAMDRLGISESEYNRMMRDVEPVLALRANREAQGGITVPCVIKIKGRRRIYSIPPAR